MKEFFLAIALSIFGLMSAQNSDHTKSIDSLMNSFQQNNAFSGSVLLQKDGETVYRVNSTNLETILINTGLVPSQRFLRQLLLFSL